MTESPHRAASFCGKIALFTAVSLFTLITGKALAGNADIDSTYVGGGGFLRSLSDYGSRGTTGALQPDGKLLIVGAAADVYRRTDFGIARHLAEGEPDFTFGAGTSQKVFDIFNWAWNNEPTEVAYTSSGIYLAGYTFGPLPYMTVAKLTPAGELDVTYGVSGFVTIQMGNSSMINGIAVQHDGKLVIVGSSEDPTTKQDFVAVRLNTNGSTDSSFGLMGKVRIPLSANDNDLAHGVVVRDNGDILIVGETRIGSQFSTDVVCLNQYGDLCAAFGNNGIARLQRPGYSLYGRTIALDGEGRIVIGSDALQSSPFFRGIHMSRLNANGTLDTTYNGSGHLYVQMAQGPWYELNAMEILPTGQALVTGQLRISNGEVATIFTARIAGNGTLDSSYNNGAGYKLGDIDGSFADPSSAEFLSILPNGRFYVGGYGYGQIFVIRYQGDALDLVPNQLGFPAQANVPRSTLVSSPLMYIDGLSPNARVPVTVGGGFYSLNGGQATNAPGMVKNGDSIQLIHTSSASYYTTATTTLHIGGLAPANNRSNIIGERMIATFESTTGGISGGPGGGYEP